MNAQNLLDKIKVDYFVASGCYRSTAKISGNDALDLTWCSEEGLIVYCGEPPRPISVDVVPDITLQKTAVYGEELNLEGESIDWIKMAWVAAIGDGQYLDYERPFSSYTYSDSWMTSNKRRPSLNGIKTKLGVQGLRLFIYFHVSPLITTSIAIQAGTNDFIKGNGLEDKVIEAFQKLTEPQIEHFTRKFSQILF